MLTTYLHMSIFFFQLSSFHLNFNKCCIYIILDFLGFMISLGKIWDEIIFYTLTLHFQRNRCLKCTLVFIHGNLSSTLYFHDILWSPSTFYPSPPSAPPMKISWRHHRLLLICPLKWTNFLIFKPHSLISF